MPPFHTEQFTYAKRTKGLKTIRVTKLRLLAIVDIDYHLDLIVDQALFENNFHLQFFCKYVSVIEIKKAHKGLFNVISTVTDMSNVASKIVSRLKVAVSRGVATNTLNLWLLACATRLFQGRETI
ncbi:hypothetical protein BIW53_01840 [Pseudoalteromonas byunsanensis]|uniref:Uncharacterized protein n=1 Tax=Pseudoalteromonas byunsanensis TaxID=327939 RepID=A0A1S1NFA5_9GAMM|nr:hypothetical protein BIW53_01840 [Pseudoalteromonas byunsanensis]